MKSPLHSTVDSAGGSRDNYQFLFEKNPLPMFIYDTITLQIIEVNDAAIFLYGYTKNEFLSLTVKDIRPREDVKEFIEQVLTRKDVIRKTGIRRHKKKSGEIIYVEITSHHIIFKNKACRFVLINDVTIQKTAQDKLLQSEAEHRGLFESANDSIIIFEPSEIILDVNAEACKIYGYNRDEFIGRNLKEFTVNVEEGEKQIEIILQSGSIRDFETKHRSRSGEFIDLLINATLISYQNKTAILSINRNITHRKQIELALKETEQKLREVLDHTNNLFYTHDVNNMITYVSPRSYEFLGCSPEEAKVRWTEFITDNPLNEIGIKSTELAIKTGLQQPPYELEIRKKNNELIWVEVNETPVLKDGKTSAIVGSLTNITDRKKMENEIRQREEYYRTFTDILPQTVFEINLQGKITFTNKTGLLTFGYTEEEFVSGLFLEQMLAPEDRKRAIENFGKVLNGLNIERNEYTAIRKDGTSFPVLVYVSPVIRNNKASGIRGIVLDITQIKNAEEKLRESEDRYRKIFEEHTAIKLIIDPLTQQIIDANIAAADFYGWSADELKSMYLTDLSVPGGKNIKESINNISSGKIGPFVSRHKTRNGILRDVEIYSSPIKLQGRTVIHSIIHDITEKRLAEENLKILSKAIEQSPVSVVITDLYGKIEYVNKKFCSVTGYDLNEVIDKNPNILKSGEQSAEFYRDLWETILSGNIWRGEFCNKKKSGDLYIEDAIISPIYDGSGITHFVAVKEDITQRKQMLEEIIIAKEKAEEANKLKSNFLANMSHELRTPLIGILGYAEILSDEITDEEHLQMLSSINYSGQRLLETLNLILDLSRIEQNKYDTKMGIVQLSELTQSVIAQFRPMIDKKGLSLNVDIEEGIIFESDENALISILNNLMSNAVKYTDTGRISLEIKTGIFEEKECICITISDTGIGISPDNIAIVFDEFRQVSEGYNRRYQGTGLGLTITKKLVEHVGGKIEVESEINKGTKFIVKFPLMKSAGNVPRTKKVPSKGIVRNADQFYRRSVLVLEDDKLSLQILTKYLENKYEVKGYNNVEDAIESVTRNNFDAFLIDINLSGNFTGIDFLKYICSDSQNIGKPMIAATAYAMKGDKEHFLKEGFTHYISKPFFKNELLNLLETAFKDRDAA